MKIFLFDDHELFARSIQLALQPTFPELEIYTQAHDSLAVVQKGKPEIILMDIHLNHKNGLDEGRLILEHFPKQKLIFLSGYDPIEYIESAKKMGAKGFLSKNGSLEELIHSIQLVDQGHTCFPNYQPSLDPLTDREKQILQLSAQGLSQQAIADQLGIGRRTVASHIQHILEKLQVGSTISAVMKGIELGLIRINI